MTAWGSAHATASLLVRNIQESGDGQPYELVDPDQVGSNRPVTFTTYQDFTLFTKAFEHISSTDAGGFDDDAVGIDVQGLDVSRQAQQKIEIPGNSIVRVKQPVGQEQ